MDEYVILQVHTTLRSGYRQKIIECIQQGQNCYAANIMFPSFTSFSASICEHLLHGDGCTVTNQTFSLPSSSPGTLLFEYSISSIHIYTCRIKTDRVQQQNMFTFFGGVHGWGRHTNKLMVSVHCDKFNWRPNKAPHQMMESATISTQSSL